MSNPFFKRLRTLRSGLVYFLPALAVFAVAAFVPQPLMLAVLLVADALTLAAVCEAMGIGFESTFARSILRRACAYFVLLVVYTAFTALLTGYPIFLLLRDHSFAAALLLSGSAFVVLLALWSLWPAFGLVVVWDDAYPQDGAHSWISTAMARSLTFARHLTAENDLFFGAGLIVSLALSLLAQGALALAGTNAMLADEFRIAALAIYAIVIAPLVHWLIVQRSLVAVLAERRRLRRDRGRRDSAPVAPIETPLATPAPELAHELTAPDLNAMLLRCVRSCQTELALTALARGADPNHAPAAGERDQRAVVVLACVSPDLRLLRGLIAKGADVNRVHAGLPPLIAATRDSHQGRPDAVMTLLTNGADPRCVDNEGNTPLHYAARSAQPIVAALLCDAAAPIDAVNNEAQTPLAIACAAGNRALVRFLLERRADPETARAQPALVAAAAAADDDPELIKLLLRHKARVDACDGLGRSALMTAALNGNADIAAALLKAGAQVDRVDEHGTTALMEAARSGVADVLDALAAYAPGAEQTDNLGRTALMLACQSAQADENIVRKLLALGVSRQSTTADGKRAVDFAAAAGRWNIVSLLDPDYLLPASVGDEAQPPDALSGDSPAHLLDALRFAHWHIVENFTSRLRDWPMPLRAQLFLDLAEHSDARTRAWLLDHGLDANAQLADGSSLLGAVLARLPARLAAARELFAAGAQATGVGILDNVFAALNRSDAPSATMENLALEMIERGADIFAADAQAETPLARSVAVGSASIAQSLLARGVDANARDRQGRTALFAALGLPAEQAVALTRALIRAGADPEVVAANGETPLGLALARAQSDLPQWLNWTLWKLPKRALRDADLPAAANLGDSAAVDKLLELGTPIDAVDAQGATALLRAAGAGHVDLAAHLLDRGAQIDHATPNGATPLSAAVSARRDAVVATMLDHQIAVDQRLPGGGTALMIAAALGYPEIVARLLARGADANAQDERGTRALHAAAQFAFNSRDTARARRSLELLIEKGADFNAADAKGKTALLLLLGARADPGSATDQQHLQALLSLFLVGRADVNAQDERGVSPLHACAMHGLLLPARALLAARADPERRDALERTPRDVANLLGYVDVAAELGLRMPMSMPTPGQPAALR
jgi:ankyrin repeat protein